MGEAWISSGQLGKNKNLVIAKSKLELTSMVCWLTLLKLKQNYLFILPVTNRLSKLFLC